MWITTCISSGVFDGKNYKYVFRPQAAGDQYGMMTTDFIAQNSKSKFGKEPKDLRVAIIHEDGAYGVDVAKGNEAGAKKAGFNVVLKEGYSATAPDLSALVTKLKRAKPDVIFHTGYNPDITLLFRQAREQGLKFGAIVGHGAGYGVYEKLKEGLGADANYLFNTDPISIWLANQKTMDPKLPPVIKMVGEEFDKLKPGVAIRSAHVGIGASNAYVFLDDVLPRAIKKYGGIDPGRAAQGGARYRHPRRRHHARLRRQVLRRRQPVRRTERALVPGGAAVHRRQVVCGVAEEPDAARDRAAAAEGDHVQQSVGLAAGLRSILRC